MCLQQLLKQSNSLFVVLLIKGTIFKILDEKGSIRHTGYKYSIQRIGPTKPSKWSIRSIYSTVDWKKKKKLQALSERQTGRFYRKQSTTTTNTTKPTTFIAEYLFDQLFCMLESISWFVFLRPQQIPPKIKRSLSFLVFFATEEFSMSGKRGYTDQKTFVSYMV